MSDEHGYDSEEFLVTLGGGGGPVPFHLALARKFHELAQGHSCCAILTPVDRPIRYVQALVTSAGVRVESVGSRYLDDDEEDQLTTEEIAMLDELGWLAPPEHDDPEWMWPYNWWREIPGPRAFGLAAEMLVATLIDVHGLLANEPVHLEVFPASNEHYRWEPDAAHPSGGQLIACEEVTP